MTRKSVRADQQDDRGVDDDVVPPGVLQPPDEGPGAEDHHGVDDEEHGRDGREVEAHRVGVHEGDDAGVGDRTDQHDRRDRQGPRLERPRPTGRRRATGSTGRARDLRRCPQPQSGRQAEEGGHRRGEEDAVVGADVDEEDGEERADRGRQRRARAEVAGALGTPLGGDEGLGDRRGGGVRGAEGQAVQAPQHQQDGQAVGQEVRGADDREGGEGDEEDPSSAQRVHRHARAEARGECPDDVDRRREPRERLPGAELRDGVQRHRRHQQVEHHGQAEAHDEGERVVPGPERGPPARHSASTAAAMIASPSR